MTSTATEHGRAIIRRFTEDLWDQGNLAVADEIIAHDFVDYFAKAKQVPSFVRLLMSLRRIKSKRMNGILGAILGAATLVSGFSFIMNGLTGWKIFPHPLNNHLR